LSDIGPIKVLLQQSPERDFCGTWLNPSKVGLINQKPSVYVCVYVCTACMCTQWWDSSQTFLWLWCNEYSVTLMLWCLNYIMLQI